MIHFVNKKSKDCGLDNISYETKDKLILSTVLNRSKNIKLILIFADSITSDKTRLCLKLMHATTPTYTRLLLNEETCSFEDLCDEICETPLASIMNLMSRYRVDHNFLNSMISYGYKASQLKNANLYRFIDKMKAKVREDLIDVLKVKDLVIVVEDYLNE
jgi:hypothetical protein